MRAPALFIILSLPLLSGCIARTAVDIVTAPVKVAGQVVDWTTTSQDEADRSLGREVRRREAAIGRLERERRREAERCDDGNRGACERVEAIDSEMATLREGPN
jgi:hypothetical protein